MVLVYYAELPKYMYSSVDVATKALLIFFTNNVLLFARNDKLPMFLLSI